MCYVAEICIDGTVYHIDKLYDYLIPSELECVVAPGVRVIVPFGRGNRRCQGVVFNVKRRDDAGTLKMVEQVIDSSPVLSNEMLKLAQWMKLRTFCKYYDAINTILPTGLRIKLVNYYSANPNSGQNSEIINYLRKFKKPVSEKQIFKVFCNESSASEIAELVKSGDIIKSDNSERTVKDASEKMVRLCINDNDAEMLLPQLTEKQRNVMRTLIDVQCACVKELAYFSGVTANVINTLQKKKYIELFQNQVYRRPVVPDKGKVQLTENKLTEQQQCAFENIFSLYKSGKPNVSLLYGVTGSGKTQVFLNLVDEVIKDGKGVIVMIPEISLTPQTLSIFYSRYGDKTAVFHSGLSLGERLDEWYRVKRGEALIAIGTRSAVFAPFENLGLIIIDEEQEHTYKSESAPRYHARDVAKFRCAENNALLVLASATPSIESYTNAVNGRYSLSTLTKRYSGAELPEVSVIDMRNNLGTGSISSPMLAKIVECYESGHQSIILMNRRGYSTYAACKSCKTVVTCPNCSISLTYHQANGRLMCHYCGYSIKPSDGCPECSCKEFSYFGSGTQRVEEELMQKIPGVRTLRLDADTTMSRYSYENKLKSFSNMEYDILIGTQMVAKGLDFGNVTLAGVLSADQTLYSDDFRSVERTFSLLTQLVGRSGRGEFKGKAIVQTYTPENPIIKLASLQDYDSFYKTEIKTRRHLIYPPFCDICVVSFTCENEQNAVNASFEFLENLKKKSELSENKIKMIILGPVAARVAKISNRYRYRIIVKCKCSSEFRAVISELLCDFEKSRKYSEVSVYADINPDSII